VRALQSAQPRVKVHLIGHSFGGRVVAATALGREGDPPLTVSSLTLLQAAFSHNGFSPDFDRGRAGFFRRVVAQHRVRCPTLITHTVNDRAVGIAYPLASRFAGQDAAALGDASDRYGGIGRNGAVKTPEADAGTLLAVGRPYRFAAGRLHNLQADAFITNHSDIAKPEVAAALLAAIAIT